MRQVFMISAIAAWAAMFAADAGRRVPLKLPDVFEFNIDVDIRKYLGG